MKKSVALLVSSLSVFALCSNVEGMGASWRQQMGAAKAANAAKTQAVKHEGMSKEATTQESLRKLEETRQNCNLLIQELYKLFIQYDNPLTKKKSIFQFISSISYDKYMQKLKGVQDSCKLTIDHIQKLYGEIQKQGYSSPTIFIENAQENIANILNSSKEYPSGVRTKNQKIVVTKDTIAKLQEICEYLKTILMQ